MSLPPPLRGLCGLLAGLMLPATVAFADQYRSEVRELESAPPAQQSADDPQKLLQSTTDPYAKALLLRELAAKAAGRKDYAKAVQLLEQAIAQNALSGIAAEQMRSDLSQLLLATGDYKKVLPQLERQYRAGNAAPELLVALGAAYIEQKRYKDAVPLLQKALETSRKPDPSWRRALAAALMGAGREKEAIPLLERLLKDEPKERENWLRLAALHLKYGNRERAAAILELAGRLGHLQTADDRLRLVQLTAQLGAPFEAGSALQGWMERNQVPGNAANWKLLASLWLSAREARLASAAIDKTLSLAPSAELYRQLAQLQMDRENYSAAAAALEQAVALGARDGPTQLALGMARYQQADTDGALQAFREAAGHGATRAQAAEWVKYLESGLARDQAMAAAAQRRQRSEEAVRLSGRLGGGTVTLAETVVPAEGPGPSARGVLTPIGAEAPGNRDGSIPAWEGGLSRAHWPASFKPGERLVDPYAADQPLFTITAANLAQHRARLAPGYQALFARNPDFQMPVFRSRRSAAYPQAIYTATQANDGKARLSGSDALENARLGFPFPHPRSGVEVMWNHRTRYRGDTLSGRFEQAVIAASGKVTARFTQDTKILFRYGNIQRPADLATENKIAYGTVSLSESGRSTDFVALFHETANSLKDSRDIWVLIVKLGRMLRIPPVGYDQPMPGSDGLMFVDMLDMYNGAFDRYVWKLTGKRELYVPYNAYRLGQRKGEALPLRGTQLDPALTRYELHRVWVIEATERGGTKHSFGKRTFYVDEDSWTVVLVENEDRQGRPWRLQEGHLVPLYDVQAALAMPVMIYDLKDGRTLLTSLPPARGPALQAGTPLREADFMPANVKIRYSR